MDLKFLEFINERIVGPAVPIVLIGAGLFFLIKLGAFHLLHPIKVFRPLFAKKAPSDDKNGISPVKALLLALAGTLGVGNIVGVASAISFGGAGAVFWMWISAFAAMLLKYSEIVLAHRHRRFDASGKPHGSAMYYIKDAFSATGLKRIGALLAALFAVLCIVDSLSMGCVIQVNAVSYALSGVFDLPRLLCGVFVAVSVAVILFRGGSAVSKVTEVLVPAMSGIYVILSLSVMIIERGRCADAFASIFSEAFSFRSLGGGVLGFFMSRSVRLGTIRGVLSNEAGCGTAPIAHAESNAESAAEQGVLGIAEVFIDTIVLCTMTALVVLISYDSVSQLADDPVMMTINAYSAVLGDLAGALLAISVLLFGYATVVCWAHYGVECVRYLFKRKSAVYVFEIVYCLFITAGAVIAPNDIWTISDLALGLMTLINVPVLCGMSREVKVETDGFLEKLKKRSPK